MKKLHGGDWDEIRRWMRRCARPLERSVWECNFEGGPREPALSALAAFQNEDGGFGHALEADNWNPNSSPVACMMACTTLDALGMADASHPIVSRLLAYLDATCREYGWPFSIPSNDEHPHAPWHGYSEAYNRDSWHHATATLAGFVLRVAPRDAPVYAKALALAERLWNVEIPSDPTAVDPHCVMALSELLESVRRAGLGDRLDCAALTERLRGPIDAFIERDPAKWATYSMRPSMFIKSPQSPFYAGNEAAIDLELDYILQTRRDVWDITWRWAGYEREFEVARVWWMGLWAILNTAFLLAFGRVERAR